MFKKIFVPYDLSPMSGKALEFALKMAETHDSELKVLHILDHIAPFIPEQFLKQSSRTIQQIQALIQKNLEALTKNRPFGTSPVHPEKISIHVECGDTVSTLITTIEKEQPDLVVMGSHGRTALKYVLLGSVTEKVLRHSLAPVLIVRQNHKLSLEKILIPVDFSETAEESLLLASQLRQDGKTQIHLAHIIPLSELSYSFPNLEIPSLPIDEQALKETSLKQLDALAVKHPHLHVKTHVRTGFIQQELSDLAKEIDCDLVLMPTHARTGLSRFLIGSSAEVIARYAPCHTLTFCPQKYVLDT